MSRAHRTLGAALVLFALTAAGCGPGEGAAPHLAKAEGLERAGKLDDALIELRIALKAEPKSAAVNFRLARLLHRREQIPDAVYFYEEALRIDPRHADSALALAFLMLGDDVDYAEKLVEGVIERDPKNSLAWVRRSDIALARGDADAALSAALTAGELGPDNARALIQAGIVHRAQIRRDLAQGATPPDALYQSALTAFERARDAKDDSATHEIAAMAWVERANTLASWPSHAAEAAAAYREAFEAAIKLGDSHDPALDATLAYAQKTQDVELARWAYERGVEIHPERIDLWRRLARTVDPADAESSPTLARLIEKRPKDARAHATFARDLASRGHTPEALAHLERVVSAVEAPGIVRFAQVQLALAGNDEAAAKSAGDRLAKEAPGSFEDRMAHAEFQKRARDWAGAADSIARAIDGYGETAALQTSLAEMRLMQGDPAAALDSAARGLALSTTPMRRVELLRLQARAHLANGAFADAVTSFERVAAIAKGRVATPDLVPYARALYATQRPVPARALLETALALPSPPVEAVVLFIRLEGAQARERSEALLAKALESAPRHPTLLEEAARFDLAAGRPELAKARLEAAIQAAPGYAPLHTTLARLLFQMGDANGAIRSAEEALRLDPETANPMSAGVLVAAYSQLGKSDEAQKRLERGQAEGTLGTGGQVLLARMLTANGSQEQAIALLERIVAKSPNLAGPKNDLAYLLVVANRDLDRAVSLAQEARAALPGVGSVADTLGFAYLAKGLPDAALPQFEEAVALAPERSPEWGLAQLHRGQAFQALGRVEDGVGAAKAALEAEPFDEQAQARELLAKLQSAG